jgi:hypothetical protein
MSILTIHPLEVKYGRGLDHDRSQVEDWHLVRPFCPMKEWEHHMKGRSRSHPVDPLMKPTSKHVHHPVLRHVLDIDCLTSFPSSINTRAKMRFSNLIQLSLFALSPVLSYYVIYIGVPVEQKNDIKVFGKMSSDVEPTEMTAAKDSPGALDYCILGYLNGTNPIIESDLGKCEGWSHIAITMAVYFRRPTDDPRPLKISMPGYDLSVSLLIRFHSDLMSQCNVTVKVDSGYVHWVVRWGLWNERGGKCHDEVDIACEIDTKGA